MTETISSRIYTLWLQSQNGDEKAFETLFRELYRPLCSYSYKVLKDWDEAENIVQNMFCKIWERRHSTNPENPKAYFYAAVFNQSINFLKKKEKHSFMTIERTENASNPLEKIEQNETIENIAQAVLALPKQQQLVFGLCRYEDRTYKEVAEELNISIKTVENHMGQALKNLRLSLKDHLYVVILLLISRSVIAALEFLTSVYQNHG